MQRLFCVCLLACALSFPSPAAAQDSPELALLKAAESVFTTRIRDAEPSVVAIARVRIQSSPEIDPFRRPRGLRPDEIPLPSLIPNQFGTGVVVGENGLILTMYHVVRGGPTRPGLESGDTQLLVKLSDRRSLPAYIHAADPRSDLAILKIDASGLKPLAIDFDAPLQKGQILIGLGNPYAIARDGSPSAGWGILANIGRPSDEPVEEAEDTRKQTVHNLGTLLHVDMRLDLGASGSPLLNLDGKLVGLSTSLAAIAGYEKSAGFAVPVNPRFRRIIEDLIAGQEVGYGFLGINNPTEVSPEQISRLPADAPHRRGAATFGHVMRNTPADGRLRKDDVVVEVGRRPAGRPDTEWSPILGPNDLMREVALTPPGSEIELRLWRDNMPSLMTVSVTLGKWPVADDEGIVAPNRPTWRGMQVDYTTSRKRFLLRKFGIPTEASPGVLVTAVAPDSPAARAEIQPGDIILKINRTPVSTPRQFHDLLANEGRTVSLQLERRTIELPAN